VHRRGLDSFPELGWRDGTLPLDRPRVMGIVNVTPDSFSDGGRFLQPDAAVDYALRLVEEGAAIIDVGGESTRPGAVQPSEETEIRRVVPVIERLAADLSVPISVDTSRASVIRAATRAGASVVNDIRALREPGAFDAVLEADCAVCLMHMRGTPRDMQMRTDYRDLVEEVSVFLRKRVHACVDSGMAPNRIMLDPGFGFSKTLAHNMELLRRLPELLDLGYPLLVGLSRKASIGLITGRDRPRDRLAGSLAAAVIAAWLGASIVRAHDVKDTVEALAIVSAVREGDKA